MIPNDLLIDETLLEEKIDVVLVLLNRDLLDSVIQKLDLDKIKLNNILMDRDPEEPVPLFIEPMFYELGEEKIPVTTFANVRLSIRDYKTFIWLICGYVNGADDAIQMKNLLMAGGVPEDNIINFNVAPQISGTWLANLRHIEEHGANFFVTGNEYTQVDVDLNLIPTGARGGVNLADTNQTLRQGYLTAKHVFAHVRLNTIKFVLIGLEPHSFYQADSADFVNGTQNLQYTLTLDEPNARDEPLMSLINDDFKKIFTTVTAEQPDINFDGIKSNFNGKFSMEAIETWEDAPQNFSQDNFDDNIQILNDYVELKDYIELCLANGAKPVGVIFPFAPAVRKNFDKKFLAAFRKMIHRLEENYDFICVDMFDLNINYDCFCDMTHLNAQGQVIVNSMIALKLYTKNLIYAENFCTMSYKYLYDMSNIAPQDEYNELLEHVLEVSVQRIRNKKKIKIGFVLHEPTQWFGDELYNLFVRDKRFEITLFLCMRVSGAKGNTLFEKNFLRSLEYLRPHVASIFVPESRKTFIPSQDVLIFMSPFLSTVPLALRAEALTAETLIAHIPYMLDIFVHKKVFYNRTIFHVAWKIFLSSVSEMEVCAENNSVGMSRGVYSGYPRMDVFFKNNAQFKFDWKMAKPDAKKIIWAPSWSVTQDTKYATFQWNYTFMYEFAKAHPETSWVVKPHTGLFSAAIKEKFFASVEAFEKYLQAWDALPNARVVIGDCYQNLFATSDALIHDIGSFIAEYQYVDKPVIYLTHDIQQFNNTGNKIFRASYPVDGQDLDAIAATIQHVIIEGDDYKAVERREVFDKYLNYPKAVGMSAGKFIYHSIADDLKGVSE